MLNIQQEELFGLTQGQQFLQYQSKIKNTVAQRQGFKESFQNYIIDTSQSYDVISINNSNEQRVMINKLKDMEKQYQELLAKYKQTDVSLATMPELIVIRDKLAILGNDIATYMENLYNYNDKIYEKMSMNKEEFKEAIKQYRSVSISLKEGFNNIDPRDINSLLSDSDTYVTYENYNYVMWSILAIGALTITYKLLK